MVELFCREFKYSDGLESDLRDYFSILSGQGVLRSWNFWWHLNDKEWPWIQRLDRETS